jgi:hypothetical protein
MEDALLFRWAMLLKQRPWHLNEQTILHFPWPMDTIWEGSHDQDTHLLATHSWPGALVMGTERHKVGLWRPIFHGKWTNLIQTLMLETVFPEDVDSPLWNGFNETL